MDVNEQIASLYEKDTKLGYANLQALEALSAQEATLYPYTKEFIAMLKSDKYVVRVRGFRLLCLQAKCDSEGIIDGAINEILTALNDEKPTAVRQMLQYLGYLAPYKKPLHPAIRRAVLSIDLSRFKDTMMPLIEKDIGALLKELEA